MRFPSTPPQKERLLCRSPFVPGHLPVTESLCSRQNKAVNMPDIQKFDLREWLVPPILLPLICGLVIAGAIIMQW